MKHFSEMNLKPELVEALKRINFIKATDVQEQVIPIALTGKDVIVRAKTGTGKTGAFLIPIIQSGAANEGTHALVVVPTRELAMQIYDFTRKLRLYQRENAAVVYGGASINIQIQSLRHNPGIVIGTPGRIIDLIERGALDLSRIRFLVLDEADTMLDMGFIDDIEFIMSKTPERKQTLLFSATMPERIINVARRHMHEFSYMKIGNEEELVVNKIKHYYCISEGRFKFANLLAYIKQFSPKKAIIFVQTQYAADAIYNALRKQGIESILLHGGLTQAKREHSMRTFKRGAQFLIATNIAARGIDIEGISDVINFDIPEDPHVYVHRVGRSARMNADGKAFSIVGVNQKNLIRDIEYMTNVQMERLTLDFEQFRDARAFMGEGRGHGFDEGRPRFRGGGGGGGRFYRGGHQDNGRFRSHHGRGGNMHYRR
ncbi:MAG: DEAD/DEAH box helicase [Candidatus Micrarchaeota archaeon]|nr:DEAD/DEAH box helicase [Candidatus Micrarchaeota archaeon]